MLVQGDVPGQLLGIGPVQVEVLVGRLTREGSMLSLMTEKPNLLGSVALVVARIDR